MSSFNRATLLITGGTGSFGNAVFKHFSENDIGEIRIFRRDEKKQDDMRHETRQIIQSKPRKSSFILEILRDQKHWIRDVSYCQRLLQRDCYSQWN